VNLIIIFLLIILPVAAFGAPDNEEKNPICIIKTSNGDIYIELFKNDAPKTVQNFIGLAEGKKEFTGLKDGKKVKRPFYDDLIFHRVIKNFMIQGGCPRKDGTGGPGYSFEDEINANALGLDDIKVMQEGGGVHPYLLIRSQADFQRTVLMPLYRQMKITSREQYESRKQEIQERMKQLTLKACYENLGYRYDDTLKSQAPKRGMLAMANSGPNTNGSQFFINLIDTPWLTGKHTVFGKVIKGMEIIDEIGETPVDNNNRPIKEVLIHTIRLID
jgi:peptidyl-prolyl cis-trans isomerase A (cyclophilin A)